MTAIGKTTTVMRTVEIVGEDTIAGMIISGKEVKIGIVEEWREGDLQ